MNKQALCQTGLFLKGKGEYMNRTSKMGALFQDGFLFFWFQALTFQAEFRQEQN